MRRTRDFDHERLGLRKDMTLAQKGLTLTGVSMENRRLAKYFSGIEDLCADDTDTIDAVISSLYSDGLIQNPIKGDKS